MKYKIGKIAQMLGVSIETVRNYEKMGLVHPQRSDENAYRLYDAIDLNILRRARAYASYGIPMKQSAELMLNGTIEDVAAALAQCDEALTQRLAFDTQLLMLIRQRRRDLSRISVMQNEGVVENCPAMYGILYRDGLTFSADPAVQTLLREWNTMRPFTEAFVRYDKASFSRGERNYSHGLCIEEEFAPFFGIEPGEHVHYFPSRKCLYIYTLSDYEPDLTEKKNVIDPALRMLESRGLTMADDPFSRVLHTSKASGEYKHYMELWIPVE